MVLALLTGALAPGWYLVLTSISELTESLIRWDYLLGLKTNAQLLCIKRVGYNGLYC